MSAAESTPNTASPAFACVTIPSPSRLTGPPRGATIRVFAREVAAVGQKDKDLPVLVYLQGGPGVNRRVPQAARRHGWRSRSNATASCFSTSAARGGLRRCKAG
ncbi:hypothetical protein QWZ10_14570 [Paracoccus cavernae]|uniref:Uncharacterized protein n=1 Tax=Paracoccus cavernae TaxID=1571207 RepID=A0ABT8DB24_9RHOB|nr:hypothetical protein [Paracoccus cavernae]